MPLPAVLPTDTVKRLSARNCASACTAPKRGMPSMSPASSAATWAALSLMKRKVTRRSLMAATSRKPSQRTRVMALPFCQLSSRNGPVPTGWVAVVAALLGLRITAVASPRRKGSVASALFSVRITRSGCGVAIDEMFSNTVFLALLVLSGALARSKLNFTASALNGVPSWKLTPLRSLKV